MLSLCIPASLPFCASSLSVGLCFCFGSTFFIPFTCVVFSRCLFVFLFWIHFLYFFHLCCILSLSVCVSLLDTLSLFLLPVFYSLYICLCLCFGYTFFIPFTCVVFSRCLFVFLFSIHFLYSFRLCCILSLSVCVSVLDTLSLFLLPELYSLSVCLCFCFE